MSASSVSSLQNKLKGEWTAHNALLSLHLLPEIEATYEQLEKHTKLRVLIAFLLLDDNKRSQYSKDISSICLKAIKETDMWIRVTCEMVIKRLGLTQEESPILQQMATRCLDKFMSVESFEYSPYFLPLEYKYLDPSLLPSFVTQTPSNRHFTSSMEMPRLIPLEFLEGGGLNEENGLVSTYPL